MTDGARSTTRPGCSPRTAGPHRPFRARQPGPLPLASAGCATALPGPQAYARCSARRLDLPGLAAPRHESRRRDRQTQARQRQEG
ncbi:hypothetical protein ABTX15_11070 [Micromonospora sp. NPDC094482]|uniref:hypothetical protein n=1 Tax=unclassified Micromonospora TaxID=2617518 RepID=UPI0033338D08